MIKLFKYLVSVATHWGLCPISQETALAAPMLCTEDDPNGLKIIFFNTISWATTPDHESLPFITFSRSFAYELASLRSKQLKLRFIRPEYLIPLFSHPVLVFVALQISFFTPMASLLHLYNGDLLQFASVHSAERDVNVQTCSHFVCQLLTWFSSINISWATSSACLTLGRFFWFFLAFSCLIPGSLFSALQSVPHTIGGDLQLFCDFLHRVPFSHCLDLHMLFCWKCFRGAMLNPKEGTSWWKLISHIH